MARKNYPPASTGRNPIARIHSIISARLSPWSSMSWPDQVPPVPKLFFKRLSKRSRLFLPNPGGIPRIVVTVFPPLPDFSRLTSNRSPLPRLWPSISTVTFTSLVDSGNASGRPLPSKELKGFDPKPRSESVEIFFSPLSLRLIAHKFPSQEIPPLSKSLPLGSFSFPKNDADGDGYFLFPEPIKYPIEPKFL